MHISKKRPIYGFYTQDFEKFWVFSSHISNYIESFKLNRRFFDIKKQKMGISSEIMYYYTHKVNKQTKLYKKASRKQAFSIKNIMTVEHILCYNNSNTLLRCCDKVYK